MPNPVRRPTRRAAAASQREAFLKDRRAKLAQEAAQLDAAIEEARLTAAVENDLAQEAAVYARANGLPLDAARDELEARKRAAAEEVAKSEDALEMSPAQFRDHLARKGISQW